MTTFQYCFGNCSNLGGIPSGLFDNNPDVNSFRGCFVYCSNLGSLPAGLFGKNFLVTDFIFCFQNCSKLVLNADIFCNEVTEGMTRFSRVQSVNFTSCFVDAGTSATEKGTAPALWDSGKYTWLGTTTTTYCFICATVNSVTNYNDIPNAWGDPK